MPAGQAVEAELNLQVEETGPVERRLRVEIPTAKVDATFDAVYRELGRTTRIRGFRPGRAPRQVLERYFGDRARHEVLERLVQETLPEAVERQQLAVVGEPRLAPAGEPKQGGPFVYEATVEIRPSIELKKVRGLELERPSVPEPEQDPVEGYLEDLRNAHASLVSEPEHVRAAQGHVVVVDYEASRDGQPIEGAKGAEQEVEIGAGRAIPGFEDQLVGLAPGEEREFDLELPEGAEPDAQGERSAHFRVKLLEVKRKQLPELDDEFAKDASDFDSLEELRASVRERVEEGRKENEKRRLRQAAVEAAIEANPFPVPPSMVDRQLASRLSRARSELHGRVPDDDLMQLLEGWRDEWRPQAEREVQFALLVPEIAAAEDIEVTEEDVDARLREIAEGRNEPVNRVKRAYKESGLLEALRAGLLEERVVEFLVAEATLSDP
jgi:trigger factor